MITNVNIRRSHRPVAGIRQQVASNPLARLNGDLAKPTTILLGIALVGVILFSQVLHHQVLAAADRIDALENHQALLIQEQETLRQQQEQLASEAHVTALAGVKYDLHKPSPEQVHRWR